MLGLVGVAAVAGNLANYQKSSTADADPTPAAVVAPADDEHLYGPYARLSPAAIVAAVGKALDGYEKKPKTSPPTLVLDQTVRALAKASEAPEFNARADKLIDRVRAIRAAADARDAAAVKAAAQKFLLQARIDYADTAETNFLKAGMDVTVSVTGDQKQTLTLSWVLMNRPQVYNLINERSFYSTIESLGFKVVVLTDGYDSTWRYKITGSDWKAF